MDSAAFLQAIGYSEAESLGWKRERQAPVATPGQKRAELSAIHAALETSGRFLDLAKREIGQPIRCPFDHPAQGQSSTVVTDEGRIICLHASCLGRRQEEFLIRLPLDETNFSPLLRMQLATERAGPQVSVLEAHRRMHSALESARPFENSATIIRVTTGAGKTRAAVEYLDAFCTPQVDWETGDITPGRSAVMGFPTNALLREVSKKVTSDHRIRMGALAVVNDDGSFACRKHSEAKRLQNAGGDIHKQMCSGCEYRVGCPAIEGTSVGSGPLTLTNHALLPSVAAEMLNDGRFPLIVWDECPEMVRVGQLSYRDLDWMVQRFEDEARPKEILAALDNPPLLSGTFLKAYRPFIEVLRRIRVAGGVDNAVEEYCATRVARSQLDGVEPTWDAIRAHARGAEVFGRAEITFDGALPDTKAVMLKIEAVKAVFALILHPRATVRADVGGLEATVTTAAGDLWRTRGGVVLDATAPVEILMALRPDATIIDLNVKDEGRTLRIMKPHGSISRNRLSKFPNERRLGQWDKLCGDIADEAKRSKSSKLLVITYQKWLPELEAAWKNGFRGTVGATWGYYGNIRGYDRWFQEGYDMFVTVGDPYSNLGVEHAIHTYLSLPMPFESFTTIQARGELAQAHGRARSPQNKMGEGARTHLHYGTLPPWGWDTMNAILDRRDGGWGQKL